MFNDFKPSPVARGERLHRGLYADVDREIERAKQKHGWAQTPAGGALTDEECLIILVEEIGEVARAMTYDEGDPEAMEKELTQVAAMALAWRNGRRLQRAQDITVISGDDGVVRAFDGNGEAAELPVCRSTHSAGYATDEAPPVELKVFDKLTADTGEIPVCRG